MQIVRHRQFVKQMKKLPPMLRAQAQERMHLMLQDELHPLLHSHKLHGHFEGYRSINITGDYRLIYRKVGSDTIELRAVGTHHELYGE